MNVEPKPRHSLISKVSLNPSSRSTFATLVYRYHTTAINCPKTKMLSLSKNSVGRRVQLSNNLKIYVLRSRHSFLIPSRLDGRASPTNFCRNSMQILGESVNMNAYFSPANGVLGLGCHYDIQEHFIINLVARRRGACTRGLNQTLN